MNIFNKEFWQKEAKNIDAMSQQKKNLKTSLEEKEKIPETVNLKTTLKEKFSADKEKKEEKSALQGTVDFLSGKESEGSQKKLTYLTGFWEYAGKAWKDEEVAQNKGVAYKVFNIWQNYQEAKSRESSSLNAYEKISESAALNSDFVVLLVGSALVATFGLLQGSTAVIIGAMIIAPLMMPILGFALGTIWGDFKLISRSLLTLLIGVLFAVSLSAFISYLVPGSEYNREILARTGPNLFDVFIALASGFVGAYAYISPMISSSISGVAIAVALMPPLCSIGITLGNKDLDLALGATLLFLINIVGIALAASFVFWRQKIHPATDTQKEVKSRAIKQIVFSAFFLLALSVPVTWFMIESFRSKQEYSQAVEYISTAISGVEIDTCQMQEDSSSEEKTFKCTLVIPSYISQQQIEAAKEEVQKFFHAKTNIHFVTLAVFDSSDEIKKKVNALVAKSLDGEILKYEFSGEQDKKTLELILLARSYPNMNVIEKLSQEIRDVLGSGSQVNLKILQGMQYQDQSQEEQTKTTNTDGASSKDSKNNKKK